MALRAVSRSRVNQRSSGAGRGRPHIPNTFIIPRSMPLVPARLAAEVLDQIHGDQGSAGPMQELDLAHDAVADEHLIHLPGPARRGLFADDLVEPEILALALDIRGTEGPCAWESALGAREE